MKSIYPAELKSLIDKNEPIQIIDIRDPEEYDAGHLPGAILIRRLAIPACTEQISRNEKVIVYCTYGMKSDQVAIYLQEKHKFKNIYVLEGGIYDYAREVDPSINVK